ncbi:hypothetical protein ANCCAN_14615 [Ancylostoma caninum]|uniref:Secreted protein n=1 Tax=Ancylostoma caninum TaxID=29170 RepID=A0A368G831_ANCCA|nr:hypothetical protein ANCCAN_14615 [Ancylostoma caninum]
MWLRVAAVFGILRLTEAFQDCPNGCDCLPDPLVESSFLYVCRWSSLPSDFHFSNSSSIRSLQIVCEGGFSLPNDLFRGVGGVQHLRIEVFIRFLFSSFLFCHLNGRDTFSDGACRWAELPDELLAPLSNLRSLHLHEVRKSLLIYWLSLELYRLHTSNFRLLWRKRPSRFRMRL